jgi:hypothetical protein
VAPLKELENETVGHTLEWNQLKKKLNNFKSSGILNGNSRSHLYHGNKFENKK